MNKYISKKMLVIINIMLFFLEISMVYILVKSYLNNDYITPDDVPFYEYLLNKFNNLV